MYPGSKTELSVDADGYNRDEAVFIQTGYTKLELLNPIS